jgi:hypothetical protein
VWGFEERFEELYGGTSFGGVIGGMSSGFTCKSFLFESFETVNHRFTPPIFKEYIIRDRLGSEEVVNGTQKGD